MAVDYYGGRARLDCGSAYPKPSLCPSNGVPATRLGSVPRVEYVADTLPFPHDVPTDAIAILVYVKDVPAHWDCAGFVLGAGTLEEARDEAVRQNAYLGGKEVLATKVGGRSGLLEVATRKEHQPRVDVGGKPVEAPVETPPLPDHVAVVGL